MKFLFENPETAKRLTEEMDSWIGTPWIHCAAVAGPHRAVKGVGGDCVHVIVAAYESLGFIGQQILPAHTAHTGFGDETDELSLSGYLLKFVKSGEMVHLPRSTELMIGDVLTFRFASRDHHVGAYKGGKNSMFWHAGGSNIGSRFVASSLREHLNREALRGVYRLVDTGVLA